MSSLLQKMEEARPSNEPDFYVNRILESVYANLNPAFNPRTYQKEALGRFDYYWTQHRNAGPVQLLFHMATGSGKTLIMAGLIIYLYEKGYRNFLFFVNNTNIIQKTRENFLNSGSVKYLFHDPVVLKDRRIRIQAEDNFQAAGPDDIRIVFSTIQGLHSRLNAPKENCLTYEDFADQKIVLISDEAHHMNVETRNGKIQNRKDSAGLVSWETTVNRIFQAHPGNVLLEFTATADLLHPEIAEKYDDKIIFDYPLKQFRKDGYSKEVKVLDADLSPIERALQAVLLSQYRKRIFEKNQLHIKPVILFKSKTIRDSRLFYQEFTRKIRKLKISDLERIRNHVPPVQKHSNSDHPIRSFFEFCRKCGICPENIVAEITSDFCEEKCISVNSREESEQKQIAVNTLEDERNPYRAIFAVDKLNEGWDVLNLFDIVRLYDTKGASGKTTMSEAQLIGRGARYCPFRLSPDQPPDKRKYDGNLEHELRVCEELYYHSAHNPNYICELNTALVKIGIRSKSIREHRIQLKTSFTSSDFYKSGFIFLNERIRYHRKELYGLPEPLRKRIYRVDVRQGDSASGASLCKARRKPFPLKELGLPILRKAVFKLRFYEFSNLKQYLPNLLSVSELLTSPNYAGDVKIQVSDQSDSPCLPPNSLSPDEKLEAAVSVLHELGKGIASELQSAKGSKDFTPYPISRVFMDKKVKVAEAADHSEISDPEFSGKTSDFEIKEKEWHVCEEFIGTENEARRIRWMDKIFNPLKSESDEIYWIQNHCFFKIFGFEDSEPITPDAVLFLRRNHSSPPVCHQVFISFSQRNWGDGRLTELFRTAIRESEQEDRSYIVWGLGGAGSTSFDKLIGDFRRILCEQTNSSEPKIILQDRK